MASVEIRIEIDEGSWGQLRGIAEASGEDVSDVLTRAIREFLDRRRDDPEVRRHLEDSIRENDELGRLLSD